MSDITRTKKEQIINGLGIGIIAGCLAGAMLAAYTLAITLLSL